MADTRPTASSAYELAQRAQESASNALAVTEKLQEKLAELNSQHPAVTVTDLDSVRARLEKVERTTAAETADWAPVIEELSARVNALGRAEGGTAQALASFAADLNRLTESVGHLQTATVEAVGAAPHQAFAEQLDHLASRLSSLEEAAARIALRPATPSQDVHDKVLQLMREVDAISKDRRATGGGVSYAFRGIEDAQNAVGAAMRKVGLLLRPRVLEHKHSAMPVDTTDNQGRPKTVVWCTSLLTMEYTFVSPVDGSTFSFTMVGEGKDNSDKSASKAASMACKYALFQALMIPFENVDESDGQTPVTEYASPRPGPARAEEPTYTTRPYGQAPARPAADQRGGYDAAADPSAMAGAMADEDNLMEKTAQAAYYLKQAQAQPSEVALPAIHKTLEKAKSYGILDYQVDGVPLRQLINAALQLVTARITQQTTPAAQGMTRQAQQAGQGAQARATGTVEAEVQAAEDDEPEGYEGSEQEYRDALACLASPSAPDEVQEDALRITARWERDHPTGA